MTVGHNDDGHGDENDNLFRSDRIKKRWIMNCLIKNMKKTLILQGFH